MTMKRTFTAADLKGRILGPRVHLPKADIVHPCNAWAVSAGHESWNSALTVMRGGQVICGSLFAVRSPGSKTMMGMQLFTDQVNAEALHTLVTEDGKLLVGQKANFPADLLVDQEARVKALFDNPVLEHLGMACEQPSNKA